MQRRDPQMGLFGKFVGCFIVATFFAILIPCCSGAVFLVNERQKEIVEFGDRGRVVEMIYTDHRRSAIMQNDNGKRMEFSCRYNQFPVKGDVWTVSAGSLQERVEE